MKNLESALAILALPITVDSIRQLSKLQETATGEEADMITDLWEGIYAAASEDVLRQAYDEGLL